MPADRDHDRNDWGFCFQQGMETTQGKRNFKSEIRYQNDPANAIPGTSENRGHGELYSPDSQHPFQDHRWDFPFPNLPAVELPPTPLTLASSTECSPSVSAGPSGPSRLPIPRARGSRGKRAVRNNNAVVKARVRCRQSWCRRSFSRAADLTRHNDDVHGEINGFYRCNVDGCLCWFKRPDKVKEHCQTRHQQARGKEEITFVPNPPSSTEAATSGSSSPP